MWRLALLLLSGGAAFDLDGDGRPDRIEVTPDGRITALGHEARVAGTPAEIDAGVVGGRRVVLVTTPREAVILGWNGGFEELWRGAAGPKDVDGEAAVRVELRGGEILRYEARPDVADCEGTPLPIAAARFDATARKFRPAPRTVGPATPLARAGAAIAETARPAVFHVEAATVAADDGAPRELEDGDPKTDWPAPGGAVFVVRGSAEYPLVALRVRGRGVTALHIQAGNTSMSVTGTGWFSFPAGLRSRCATVTVSGGGGRLSELAFFTELETSGRAVEVLADKVAGGDDGAGRILLGWGDAGSRALASRAARATPAERRRLVAALARFPAEPGLLVSDLPSAEVRDALIRLGPKAVPALTKALGAEDEKTRLAAIELLGRMGETGPLAPRLGKGTRDERSAVVRALASRLTIEAALTLAKDEGEADAWLVVAGAKGERAPAVAAVTARLATAAGYELRYRLAQAAARLGATEAVRELLAREPEPAIRTAAVAALPATSPLLAVALADADPGVRLEALAGLARAPDATIDAATDAAVVARLADAWPIVRRGAAEALAGRCDSRTAIDGLIAAAADPDETVVRAALAALVRCGEPRAGGLLLAVARDEKKSGSLRGYAASLLGPAQARELGELFDRMRRAAVDSDDALIVAEGAARALGRIGGPAQASALLAAAADPSLPVLAAAALTALAEKCPAGALDAAARAAGSGDALVVRAARLLQKRCAAR